MDYNSNLLINWKKALGSEINDDHKKSSKLTGSQVPYSWMFMIPYINNMQKKLSYGADNWKVRFNYSVDVYLEISLWTN